MPKLIPNTNKRKRCRQPEIASESEPPKKRSKQQELRANVKDVPKTKSVPVPIGQLPELNANQNPFYYEPNKLLRQMHAERLKRSIPKRIKAT